jgi:hypothetical protein
MKRRFIIIFSFIILLLVGGCGAKKEEEVVSAIDAALYYLSQGTPNCQKAIDELEKVGRQNTNSLYLQTLASAYACRGGFGELILFGEVGVIDPDPEELLGSLAQLSTSNQTAPETNSFNDLQTAIDIILYSGSKTVPSAAETKVIFGTRQANNLNLQALYMMIVQLGRYTRFYGNTSATGVKGSGTLGHVCFLDYPVAILNQISASNTCRDAPSNGSPSLNISVGATTAYKRWCQGAMLINNMIDVLDNITFSGNSSLGAIADLQATMQSIVGTAGAIPGVAAFIENLSQSVCETEVANDPTPAQYYFAALLEEGMP